MSCEEVELMGCEEMELRFDATLRLPMPGQPTMRSLCNALLAVDDLFRDAPLAGGVEWELSRADGEGSVTTWIVRVGN